MSSIYRAGQGALAQLPVYISRKYGPGTRVLLIHGEHSFIVSGAAEMLHGHGIEWAHFSGVQQNPDTGSVRAAFSAYQAHAPQVLVAVGGGSAIDTAKGVLALAAGNTLTELLSGAVKECCSCPEFIAVPTTAGSGSEATHFAVMYHEGKKYSLAHESLRPDVIYLDHDLLRSCPEGLSLAAGADAVCQCIESWWNKAATSHSREIAEKGLELLVPAFFSDRASEEMLRGANLAGQAIDKTKTTAGHALSYGLTTCYGVPHGFAVLAIMQELVALMGNEYSYGPVLQPLERYFVHWGSSFSRGVSMFCDEVWSRYPLVPFFRKACADDVGRLVGGVNVERLGNHPVQLSEEMIQRVYEGVLDRHKGD